MYELMDPSASNPRGPHVPIDERLDALARTLAAREHDEPPAAVVAAIRAHRRRILIARIGAALATAAALAAAAMIYIGTRPSRAPEPIARDPGPTLPSSAPAREPTLATLQRMNRDASAESLRLPAAAHSLTISPSADHVLQPSDAHNPEAVARIVGALH